MPRSSSVWLVTGGSSGFGRAVTVALLRRGNPVVPTARNPEDLADLARAYPGLVRPLALDVTDLPRAEEVAEATVQEFGRIDVLFNNAGYGLIGAVEEIEPAELRRQFEVNVFGAWAVTRAAIARMRVARSGHVLSMSSAGGFAGIPGAGAYSASKFALEGLSEALAGEVEPFGVRVTIVEPGLFRTDFAGRSKAEAARVIDDYDGSAGATQRAVRRSAGQQPGDPALAADAIIAVTEVDRPPRRLVLGGDAVARISAKLDSVRMDLVAARTDLDVRDAR